MSNQNARKSFMVIVLVLLLLSRSFAWLYDEYVGSGALVTTGTIAHSVIQYDSVGEEIDEDGENQTLIYESNMSNITRNSKFIEVRNTGTLDMEYSLTFELEGTIETAGIMYYRLYEITNDVNSSVI